MRPLVIDSFAGGGGASEGDPDRPFPRRLLRRQSLCLSRNSLPLCAGYMLRSYLCLRAQTEADHQIFLAGSREEVIQCAPGGIRNWLRLAHLVSPAVIAATERPPKQSKPLRILLEARTASCKACVHSSTAGRALRSVVNRQLARAPLRRRVAHEPRRRTPRQPAMEAIVTETSTSASEARPTPEGVKTIPFNVLNRWTGEVKFTAQIECSADAFPSVKLGLAVRWARKSGADLSDAILSDAILRGADLSGADLSGADLRGADLSGADLSGADLRGADLSGADLRGAVLRGADLRGADLRGAVLRSFKADLWLTLADAQAEIPGLIAALRAGRINGSAYSGECACLVGTIANVRGVPVSALDRGASRPAEQWFAMISPGDKPGDDSGGGFASKQALEWTLEFCRTFGIDPEAPPSIALTGER